MEKEHAVDAESFRRFGHEIVDWIADYRASMRDRPVLPGVAPGEIKSQLPAAPPEEGEAFEAILGDFRSIILPGMTHWNHPRWFAYFPANTSGPSILAEMLTAALGAQCMSWQTSPAATELEEVVLGWLRDLLGLPASFSGVIQDTASSATLVALLMAREVATGFRFRAEGARAAGAGRLRVYASTEAHSSVEKAAFLAGLGSESLRRITVDAAYALDVAALREAVAADRRNGDIPAAVVATVGTTSSTALDPLPEIAAFCAAENIFLHVDAAFAGSAAILPEHRHIISGAEQADSFVFNPHKWLFTNFDCSAHFVRDRATLLRTCAIEPEYLRTERDAEVINYRDWGIPLGRRFRALKLWFVLRSFGVEGLRQRLREHIRLASVFQEWLESDARFELAAPAPLSLVCFRLRGHSEDLEAEDARNTALLARVNRSRELFLTHTRLGGRYTLRLAIGQEMTTEDDLRGAWRKIREAASTIEGEART